MMSKIGSYQKQLGGFKAFVPAPFPPRGIVSWSDSLIALLSRADRAIGKLNAIDQLVPDIDFFIFMYVKKEAAFSSQIEGTQATLLDLVKAEARLKDDTTPQDVQEIKNYLDAMNFGMRSLKADALSWDLVRDMHRRLLKGVRGQHALPGTFRDRQNWIGGPSIETAVFVPPPPEALKRALVDLETFIRDGSLKFPPLAHAGLLHAQFETVHPFLDGNGRIGRLLIALSLHQKKVLSRPLLYISAFFKKHRLAYYDKLNGYRLSDDGPRQWLKFFLEGVCEVSEEAVLTAQKITILREEHIQAVSHFGRNANTALKLLNHLYSVPLTDAASAGKVLGIASKANTHALLAKFVTAGILHEITGNKRNKRFLYKEYVRQFSKE